MSFKDVENQLDYFRYTKEEVHPYSPGIARLLDLAVSYVPDAERGHERGKEAVWVSPVGWLVPLVYANGLVPVAFSEMGRFAGVDAITAAEDYYQFPQETCSMVKCVVGEWHLRRNNPNRIRRVITQAGGCEPYNIAWEVVKLEGGYDFFNLDVCYRGSGVAGDRLDDLIKYHVEQIHLVQDWLGRGKPVDEDSLREELKRRNRILEKVKEILSLRLQHPYYMRSLAVIYLINGYTTLFGKPAEFEESLDLILAEMRALPPEKDLSGLIPLMWVGGVGQEFGVYEAIDQSGAALLGFRNTPFKLYREDVPPVEALARFMVDNQGAGATVYVQDLVAREIERINAKGLILQGVLGCSYSTIEREILREHFHKKGLPSVNLEGTFQFGAPSGQLVTRTKAFVEMLTR